MPQTNISLDKVIKGLECCTNYNVNCKAECPYYGAKPRPEMDCFDVVKKDALALLKAQEPRVMTLDEVKEAAEQEKPMYVHEAKFPESTRWLIPKNAKHYGFEERGSGCQFNYYDYLSKQIGGFCCWTGEPTDAQREATPWN